MRAFGLRVRSGSAVLAVIDGVPKSWRVVHCSQVPLAPPQGKYARFPYHPLIEMDPQAGQVASREAVARVRSESQKQLEKVLESFAEAAGAGVVAGSSINPEKITNPHIRVHAMEGSLFREVVIAALDRAGIPYEVLRDKDALAQLATQLQEPESEARETIARAGRGVVKPWRVNEKLATAGALYALCMRDRTLSRNPGPRLP
jgi:hypothetical protein